MADIKIPNYRRGKIPTAKTVVDKKTKAKKRSRVKVDTRKQVREYR